jgi:hypothetical protein
MFARRVNIWKNESFTYLAAAGESADRWLQENSRSSSGIWQERSYLVTRAVLECAQSGREDHAPHHQTHSEDCHYDDLDDFLAPGQHAS